MKLAFPMTLYAVFGALLAWILSVILTKRKQILSADHPPIVDIPAEDIFNNPRTAYEKALSNFGSVIGVRRKGRLEFIVDESLTQLVLTSDRSFSFEEGTATILNLHFFFSFFRSFFRELDDLVQNGINTHMQYIVEQTFPVYIRNIDRILQDANDKSVDMFDHAHESIAEAMIILIFGKEYVNERNLGVVSAVAGDIAELTGIYQNTSTFARTFPAVWRILTWLRVLSLSILWKFFRVVGPQIWRVLRQNKWDRLSEGADPPEHDTLLNYLARKYAQADGSITVGSAIWIMALLLGIIFASVHQTASVVVWVTFELALRKEYLQPLRDEFHEIVESLTGNIDVASAHDALRKATKLDSFIREVLRTKGDTLSTCRLTTENVSIGKYTIPEGSLVMPLATLSHANPTHYGSDAHIFRPERWQGDDFKAAVTVSPSYFPFGLGRWACPGRVLAVTEIKMVIWSLVSKATPRLRDNTYKVVDPLNVTSVPPEGDLILQRFSFEKDGFGFEETLVNENFGKR